MQNSPRINGYIRAPKVRVIKDGQPELMFTKDALNYAFSLDLDLVEVSVQDGIPVCKVMDYSKFKYEQKVRDKQKAKHSHTQELKELDFRPNIEKHDIDIKVNKIRDFIAKGKLVQLVVKFKNREKAHKDRGVELLQNIIKDLSEISEVLQHPKINSDTVIARISPKK